MPRPRLELPDFPLDWDLDDSIFHGFSKLSRRRRYRPVLYLNGTQHYFGECATRQDAARAYDVLLRFFIAFTPSRAVPNFPEDFFDLASDAALSYPGDGTLSADKLIKLEEDLTEDFVVLGRSVRDFQASRENEIRAFFNAPNPQLSIQAGVRKRAIDRLEKFRFNLAAFPLLKSYNDLRVSGPSGSLLVKDCQESLNKAQETLKKAVEDLGELLENFRATL